MGDEVTPQKMAFISFEPAGARFLAFLSMQAALSSQGDPEPLLVRASEVYGQSVAEMRSMLQEIEAARASPTPIPARKVWQLGDIIFRLHDDLSELGLQLDGMYNHLSRDLAVKKKRLEKVVIMRRYIPEMAMIPESLTWGRCEKGTRRIAERLSRGLPPD